MPIVLIACFIYYAFYFYEGSAIAFGVLFIILVVFTVIMMRTGKWKYFEGKFILLILTIIVID